MIFFQIGKVAKMLYNSYKLILFLRNIFFPRKLSFFAKKIRKFANLEKLENFLKKEYLSEKKRFQPSQKLLVKVGGRKICQW